MNPKNIRTIIRWMARDFPAVFTNEMLLFVTAHFWRYERHYTWRTQQCYKGYIQYGQIPDFVQDFVRYEVYPHFTVRKQLLLEVK